MNTELLSKMVKELLLDNDSVNLPGLGSFVAEIVPATFTDNGYTINPPYRKLYFRDNIEREDDLLVKLYAAENSVSEEVAADVINGFIGEVRELLNSRKSIVLPELGRLRATKENNYFFVPFENIDIYPEGEGLEPVPLKIRTPQAEAPAEEPEPASEETVEETPVETPVEQTEETAEVSAETTEGTPEEPIEETSDETSEGEPVVLNGVEVVRMDDTYETHGESLSEEKPSTPATKPVKRKSGLSKGWLTAIIVIGSILLVAALFILLFILLSHFCPAFFDSLLWS